ncbi:hypothetical protein DFH06DRAFT_1256643, partial [Mycena polygramma]
RTFRCLFFFVWPTFPRYPIQGCIVPVVYNSHKSTSKFSAISPAQDESTQRQSSLSKLGASPLELVLKLLVIRPSEPQTGYAISLNVGLLGRYHKPLEFNLG